MNLKAELNRILLLIKSPDAFFENLRQPEQSERLLSDALRLLLLLLGGSTIVYFLFTLLNLNELQQQVQAMRSYGPPSALPAWLQDGLPWNRLLFPIIWFLMIFYGGSMRHIIIRLLGEPNPSLARTQCIGIYASTPLILFSIPSFALGSLFPYMPGPGAPAGGLVSFVAFLTTGLFVVGWVWHAVLVVKGLRKLYDQNLGRALLSWAFAPFAGTLLCCGIWFVVYFIAAVSA